MDAAVAELCVSYLEGLRNLRDAKMRPGSFEMRMDSRLLPHMVRMLNYERNGPQLIQFRTMSELFGMLRDREREKEDFHFLAITSVGSAPGYDTIALNVLQRGSQMAIIGVDGSTKANRAENLHQELLRQRHAGRLLSARALVFVTNTEADDSESVIRSLCHAELMREDTGIMHYHEQVLRGELHQPATRGTKTHPHGTGTVACRVVPNGSLYLAPSYAALSSSPQLLENIAVSRARFYETFAPDQLEQDREDMQAAIDARNSKRLTVNEMGPDKQMHEVTYYPVIEDARMDFVQRTGDFLANQAKDDLQRD